MERTIKMADHTSMIERNPIVEKLTVWHDEIDTVRIDCSSDITELKFFFLSDLHIGSAECNEKAIRQWIADIAANPNALVVLGGDLGDFGIGKIGVYEQKMCIMDQVDAITDILLPIADKIIACIPGNHEARARKKAGVDLGEQLALRLGAAGVYLPFGGVIKIAAGRRDKRDTPVVYNIFAVHGAGGGCTPGTKINKVTSMSQIVAGMDLYYMGHVHSASITSARTFAPSRAGTKPFIMQYVTQGGWLNGGGYGAAAMYRPTTLAQVVATLDCTTYAAPHLEQVLI